MKTKRRFRERAITMLLVLVMLFSMIPPCIVVIAEDDYSHLIGATVEFNKDSFYLWRGPGTGANGYSKSDLPQYLKIIDVQEVIYGIAPRVAYQLATIDGSQNSVLETYSWVWSTDVDIVELPTPEPDDGLVRGEVGLLVDGKETTTLTIARDEKTYVFTELSEVFTGTPIYRWELLIDREQNKWGTVQDYVFPYATVSRALIANAGVEGTNAVLRCIVSQNGIDYVSNELTIILEPSVDSSADGEIAMFAAPKNATSSFGVAGEETVFASSDDNVTRDGGAFQVVIQYVYWNNSPLPEAGHGTTAMPTYTATVSENYPLTATVTALDIAGFKPYVRVEDSDRQPSDRYYEAKEDPDDPNSAVEGYYYRETSSISFSHQITEKRVTVYYLPEEVSFTVNHHIQNLEDDEYTLYHTDDLTGFSLSPVGEGKQMTMYGFSNLFYDPNTPISPNGNTIIDIYYDREYYLIDFELSDGYGVMPLYVRYQTRVQVGTPQRPGYTFDGWTLNRVYNKVETTVDGEVQVTETDVTDQTIKNQYTNPTNGFTVEYNLKYTAKWKVANTNYTLIYWLENTDSTDSSNRDNYSVWHSISYSANPGDKTVAGSDNIKNIVTGTALTEVNTDYPFLTYNSSLTDTAKTVSVDGTTTVNVYYQRNEYTLRFYYAQKDGDQWKVAGMTDPFAKESSSRIERNDERELLKNLGQWCDVSSEPKLKAGVAESKKYTESTITYDGDTYKYFEFKAKYGADIGRQWPVDTMGTVERTGGSNNSWNKTTVIMSAWTGEYNVKHQHNNPNGSTNQTIKGKYEVLDDYLMWDPTYSGWNTEYNDGTISFLCFWENASKTHDWNIPELYRYKIWLPVITGETYETTVTRDGVTYYLFDYYDTCDNSTINEQTHPALTGYKKKDRISVPNGANDNTDIFKVNDFKQLSNSQYTTQKEFNDLKAQSYRDMYARAYIVNYFYTRNTHQLIKNNNAGSAPATVVPYGAKLNEYNTEPNYPIVFEDGNYTFGGWYQDQACTIPFNFNTTMPDKNVQLYANWIPTTFNFKVYQEKPTDNNPNPTVLLERENVFFGTLPNAFGGEPTRKSPVEDYIFAGWYYEDENGSEKRFDFNSMPIKQDYEIYAKWTSKVPVHYIVYYKTKENGELVDIAPPTEGKALAGITKSFMAKVGLELNEGYRTEYFPTEREHTHQMEHIEEGDGVNRIIFEYIKSSTVAYQVRHVFESESFVEITGSNTLTLVWQETMTTAHSAKLEENFQDEIKEVNVKKKLKEMGYSDSKATEIWEIIVHLSPDAFNKSLVLLPPEGDNLNHAENEIVFHWSGLYEMTIYEVHHMCETDDGYVLRGEPHVYNARYTETAKAEMPDALTFKGYKYANRYKTNNTKDQSLALKKATAGTGGLVIYLYYDRVEYSYSVRYREENGTLIPHTPVVTGMAEYQSKLTVSDLVKDINISGYTLINGSDVVVLENNNQVIDCIYRKQTASYIYRPLNGSGRVDVFQELDIPFNDADKKPTGSLATPDEGWILEGWYVGDVSGENLQDISTVGATIDAYGRLVPRAPVIEDIGKTYYFWAKFVPTSFTIQNAIGDATVNPPPALDWADQSFIYHIQGVSGTPTAGIQVRVVVIGYGSQTIFGLPAGTYTVTVESEWSWRYDSLSKVEIESGSGEITNVSGMTWTLDFGGSDVMTVSYGIPAPDVSGTTGSNSYYYITDNAYGN